MTYAYIISYGRTRFACGSLGYVTERILHALSLDPGATIVYNLEDS